MAQQDFIQLRYCFKEHQPTLSIFLKNEQEVERYKRNTPIICSSTQLKSNGSILLARQ